MAEEGFEFGPSAPEYLLYAFAQYLPLSSQARHCTSGRNIAEHVTIPGVQELTVSGRDRHTDSLKAVRSVETKGRAQKRGIQEFSRRTLLYLITKEKGMEGSRWPPSILNPVLGQW